MSSENESVKNIFEKISIEAPVRPLYRDAKSQYIQKLLVDYDVDKIDESFEGIITKYPGVLVDVDHASDILDVCVCAYSSSYPMMKTYSKPSTAITMTIDSITLTIGLLRIGIGIGDGDGDDDDFIPIFVKKEFEHLIKLLEEEENVSADTLTSLQSSFSSISSMAVNLNA